MLLILGIFAAIIFGMMSCLAPKIKNVTIDDLDWERTIDIEEVVTHNESDWSLPDDARLQYTKSEIQSYKDVLDHYETVTETKTRSVIDTTTKRRVLMLILEMDILRSKRKAFRYILRKPTPKM